MSPGLLPLTCCQAPDRLSLDGPAAHFRLFIGDLDPAISDDAFRTAFSGERFPSFVKSKVIRDKYTNKGKGFGFVSYSDPEDFLKAWKEMNGRLMRSCLRSQTPSDALYLRRQVRRHPSSHDQEGERGCQGSGYRGPQGPRPRSEAAAKDRNGSVRARQRRRRRAPRDPGREGLRTAADAQAVHPSLSAPVWSTRSST